MAFLRNRFVEGEANLAVLGVRQSIFLNEPQVSIIFVEGVLSFLPFGLDCNLLVSVG